MSVIFDAVSAIERVKLSSELAGRVKELAQVAGPLERVRLAKQVADLLQRLGVGAAQALAPAAVVGHEFPLKEAIASYSGISHSAAARGRGDAEAYEKAIAQAVAEAAPLAETDAQRAAVVSEEAVYRTDYLAQYRRVMTVRAGTYSGHIAGRSGLNSKQANSRNSALDRANTVFFDWLARQGGRIKGAVLAARSPEQLAAEQAERDAEQAKKAETARKNVAFMASLIAFKAGDSLALGSSIIKKVSKDRDGNPSKLTYVLADGSSPFDDKIDIVRVLYRGDKEALKRDAEAARRLLAPEPVSEPTPEPDHEPETSESADETEVGGNDATPTPQLVEHITGKGKTLRGIVRTDLTYAEAKAIDEYTFKKDGGYFIREKHLDGYTPPEDGSRPAPTPKVELTPEQQAQAEADKLADQQLRESKRRSEVAAKLRASAESTIEKADAELGRDRLTNTHRRASMASGILQAQEKRRAIGLTMNNLADAIESGAATHLAGITSRAAVETLQSALESGMYEADRAANLSYSDQQRQKGRAPTAADVAQAKFPEPKWDSAGTNRAKILEAIKGKRGAPALADRIRYSSGPDAAMMRDVKAMLGDKEYQYQFGWWTLELVARAERLKRAGITNTVELREALGEYLQFREGAREEDPIKKAERAIIGTKVGIDFFPTPVTLAVRMAALAHITKGDRVLEPSAGNGNLADAAKAAGAEVDVVEISSQLREILKAKGFNVAAHDFDSFEPEEKYDAILMNPPFGTIGRRLDSAHIQRAYRMLKGGGRLVAIAGEGVFIGSDTAAKAFRLWLDQVGGAVESLSAGTFNDASLLARTSANARLVVITK